MQNATTTWFWHALKGAIDHDDAEVDHEVNQHYERGDLGTTILSALQVAGKNPQRLTILPLWISSIPGPAGPAGSYTPGQATGRGSNNTIHLSCTNVIDGHVIALKGIVQLDGSIVGTDSLGGNWQVF